MKKGDKMLKKLGYEEATDEYIIKEDCIIYKNKIGQAIYFSLKDRGVAAYSEEMRYKANKMAMLDIDELKAVYRKCKELGFFRRWKIRPMNFVCLVGGRTYGKSFGVPYKKNNEEV